MVKRKRGRPPRAWRWLVHDVDCVRRRRHCSVLAACGYLAEGDYAETLPLAVPRVVNVTVNGRAVDSVQRVRVVWGKWRGMDPYTLERKYYLAKARKNPPANFST
jgi:hypothetical protein